mmetsp:Transcript_3128/g.7312  ORF Transcript_3128/g.7312 Transcript_3128/m.7312 type:complete len:210 (-) Transcript_3128:700-1329(-)
MPNVQPCAHGGHGLRHKINHFVYVSASAAPDAIHQTQCSKAVVASESHCNLSSNSSCVVLDAGDLEFIAQHIFCVVFKILCADRLAVEVYIDVWPSACRRIEGASLEYFHVVLVDPGQVETSKIWPEPHHHRARGTVIRQRRRLCLPSDLHVVLPVLVEAKPRPRILHLDVEAFAEDVCRFGAHAVAAAHKPDTAIVKVVPAQELTEDQ